MKAQVLFHPAGVKTRVQTFLLKEVNEASYALKYDHIQDAGVLIMYWLE